MDSEIVLAHQPCETCGSSDALTIYTDHTFCFSCQEHKFTEPGERIEHRAETAVKGCISVEDMTLGVLTQRGITQASCRKYGYMLTNYGGRPCQVANYYDDSGVIVGQKLRFPDKSFAVLGKLHNRFYGQHLWSNGKRLVITEGEIDTLTVSQVGGNKYPVVSLPNGAPSAKSVFKAQMDWLSNFEEIVIMFDMDEPGRKAVEEVCKIMPLGKLKIATLPLKDPNEMLQAGMTAELLNALFQAKEYKPDGIINGESLWDVLENEPDEAEGYPLPWDLPLHEMTRGVRKGELILVTAGTGTGKTTFVRQIAHHFGVNLKLKVGMMMLEENVKRTAKGLMAVHSGKRLALNRHLVTDEEYKTIFEETFGDGRYVFYEHFGSLDENKLMNNMRFLAQGEECDFVILDHISIAISGLEIDNERKATDVLITKLRSLVEETGVGMIVVSHLKRVEGTPAEEGGIISLSHLRGSQALSQVPDGVWALERNQQADDVEDKNLVKIRVLKNRHVGETGLAGYLKYNKETDRLEAAEVTTKATDLKEVFNNDF